MENHTQQHQQQVNDNRNSSNNSNNNSSGCQQNRYAHLVSATNNKNQYQRQFNGTGATAAITTTSITKNKTTTTTVTSPTANQQAASRSYNTTTSHHHHHHQTMIDNSDGNGNHSGLSCQGGGGSKVYGGGGGGGGGGGKAPTLASQQRAAGGGNYANYYNSFSTMDWREQWIIMKEKILEKVEEPQSQRRLILFIVCCALLLDNMLYMVIVPIIPDYLRSIGAWSTYTENAKWIRHNVSGHSKWERIGGQVVYEGEDSAVGFLFASKAIVQLFINPFSGAIIDRIGYEIPMMIGLTVMFFSTMVFACGQTYSVLFLARSLQGVGSAFADTAGLAMIADRFTEEYERQRALGIALAFISFGCLVAPPFGAVLYQGAGKEVPFIILSLVCLLDGSLLLLVTPPGTFAQLLPNYRPPPPPPPPPLQPTPYTQQAGTQAGSPAPQQQLATVSVNLPPGAGTGSTNTNTNTNTSIKQQASEQQNQQLEQRQVADKRKQTMQRQKSISRRHSMTVASAGEAPKGTPIYVLFRDPCIACCSGALVVANVSLAFLEPTISIWMQNTMPEIEEWQMGMIWLPAFVPHVLGVYLTVKMADKYPKYQWLIAAIGLILEGLSCLMVPFCTSFWSLIIPISIICFGLALIDTAILPTLGFLVDTRYVSVYGSIYAIADISYSLSYAIGPIIAGGIVEAIGFTALNFLIAIVTLGYTPILMMLRTIHDYEPFEADNSGAKKKKAKELAPFGQFGRPPVATTIVDEEEEEEEDEYEDEDYPDLRREAGAGAGTLGYPHHANYGSSSSGGVGYTSSQAMQASEGVSVVGGRYESPSWAASGTDQVVAPVRKPALVKKTSSHKSSSTSSQRSVKIVEATRFAGGGEDPQWAGDAHLPTAAAAAQFNDDANSLDLARNPFLAE